MGNVVNCEEGSGSMNVIIIGNSEENQILMQNLKLYTEETMSGKL